jgi:hypothetical protein
LRHAADSAVESAPRERRDRSGLPCAVRISKEKLVNGIEKRIVKLGGLALMYVLASPVLLVQWVKRLRKELAAIDVIRSGVLECPYCAFSNPLNRMATCSRCRATEPSSVLRCSFCKATFKTITCDQCSATLRVV